MREYLGQRVYYYAVAAIVFYLVYEGFDVEFLHVDADYPEVSAVYVSPYVPAEDRGLQQDVLYLFVECDVQAFFSGLRAVVQVLEGEYRLAGSRSS